MKYVLLLLALSACTTPTTVLKNSKTGQVHVCGGSADGSMMGGYIGYQIQKANDEDCVKTFKAIGFQ
jgi:phage tail tape-measure protein